MGRKTYITIALLVSFSAVCGFYILASRDEIEPYLREEQENELSIPDETTKRILLDEQLPEMAVLPNSVDEDEEDVLSRAAELRDALLESELSAQLARKYAQSLQPSDFNGIIRGADVDESENIPLELLLNDPEESEEQELPLVYEVPRKRDIPEYFIIE